MTNEITTYRPAPLAELGAEINDTHAQAMLHAGEAMSHALRCGDLLIKAKATVPHGGWLPWLRQNIAFSDRTAQAYMRLAAKFGRDKRNAVADLSVRRVLQEIATPRQHALFDDCAAWLEQAQTDTADRSDPKDWSIDDAKACIDRIRGFDEIMHRHGICEEEAEGEENEDSYSWGCLVCATERQAARAIEPSKDI